MGHAVLLASCAPPSDTSALVSPLCSVVVWIQAAKWCHRIFQDSTHSTEELVGQ